MVLTSTGAASAQGSTGNYGPSGAVRRFGTKIQGGTAYFQEGPARLRPIFSRSSARRSVRP